MARITVEDCLKNVKNRFELVLIASKRASMLAKNPTLALVDWENDKPPVVALREIAAGKINASILDEPEKEIQEFVTLEVEQNISDEESKD